MVQNFGLEYVPKYILMQITEPVINVRANSFHVEVNNDEFLFTQC